MRCTAFRLIPFVLSLSLGIFVHGLFSKSSSPGLQPQEGTWNVSEPVMTAWVPDADFPVDLQENGPFVVSFKHVALFDGDGRVRKVTLLSESADTSSNGTGKSITRGDISGMLQMVESLIYKSEFKRSLNGQPVAEWVTVETTFTSNKEQAPPSIKVKMSSEHFFWQGDIWRDRTR